MWFNGRITNLFVWFIEFINQYILIGSNIYKMISAKSKYGGGGDEGWIAAANTSPQ